MIPELPGPLKKLSSIRVGCHAPYLECDLKQEAINYTLRRPFVQ